jgi:hypothetical protein
MLRPPSRPRTSRRATALALAAAAALLAGLGILATAGVAGGHGRVRTTGDAAFVRAANALCARTLAPLRGRHAPGKLSPSERAARVESLAHTLDGLAAELRTIPVREPDRPVVGEWLATWDAYTATGRRYAAALRDDDPAAGTIRAEGNEPLTRLLAFARLNHIDQCVL